MTGFTADINRLILFMQEYVNGKTEQISTGFTFRNYALFYRDWIDN